MKQVYLKILTLLAVLWVSSTYAQEFSITADFRARGEYNNGYGTLRPTPANPAGYIAERARLGFFYNNKNEKLRFGLQIQDVRAWGGTQQINIGDQNNFSLHEAWADIMFTDFFSLKIGRQELNYDDARILGNLDWLMQGRSHDVAVFKYENPKLFTLHIGGGYNALGGGNSAIPFLSNQAYLFGTGNNWKTMQFLWMHKDFSEKFALSFLVLNNGTERSYLNAGNVVYDKKIDFSQTIGFRGTGFYKDLGLGWNANLYYQTGRVSVLGTSPAPSNSTSRGLDAWNALVELYYTKSGFKILAGFELLTGNKTGATTGTSHYFNPLYGTNHKFNGFMDYFYVGGRYGANSPGLWDPYLSFSYAQSKWNIALTGHAFLSYADIINNGTKMNNYLGTELDLTAEYKLTNWVSFQAGFSAMFASKTMPLAIGSTNDPTKFNQWAFIGVVVKPTLFKHIFNKS